MHHVPGKGDRGRKNKSKTRPLSCYTQLKIKKKMKSQSLRYCIFNSSVLTSDNVKKTLTLLLTCVGSC